MSNLNQGVLEVNGSVIESIETPVVSVLPVSEKPLDVQAVLARANTLRDAAAEDYQRFYVGGRNATKKTMQEVYGLFYLVMHSDKKDSVSDRMKAKLPESKVRKTTRESAIFIRYVFSDFNDKQVHVYSVALDVAFAKKVEPAGFITWVEGHKDEFEGIRANAAERTGSSAEPWESGMCWARGAAQVAATIVAEDWDEDEPCRVLIAVPNDDGTASVKDTEMTLEHVKAVLSIYNRDVVERNKPKGKKRKPLSNVEKKAKQQLKGDLTYQQQLVDEFRFDLSDATKRNHAMDVETAEYKLCLANAKITGIKQALKALGTDGSAS